MKAPLYPIEAFLFSGNHIVHEADGLDKCKKKKKVLLNQGQDNLQEVEDTVGD